MACASILKRIRVTRKAIIRSKGNKRERYERKLAFLRRLDSSAKFYKGAKIRHEGGYR
jgi:hypothetical protein